MSLVKFCGMCRKEDIEYANILMPDYIGFVFAKSRRQVTEEKSIYLKSILNSNILAAGVFLNHTINEVLNICSKNIIDIIQLHGDEDNNYINIIKSETKLPVIKAKGVQSEHDIISMQECSADYILFDNAVAGSGKVFDHTIIEKAENKGFKRDYFLAGGINIYNIGSALQLNPYCIDISSGIEKDGVKDYSLMKEIIEKIKGADK